MNLNFEKKKLKIGVQNPLILLYGARRSGKSTWMNKFITEHINDYDLIIIIKNSSTEKDIYITNKKIKIAVWNLKMLKNLIKLMIYFNTVEKQYKIMLIFDDILTSLTDKNNRYLFNEIATEGRHYYDNLTIFILSQALGNNLLNPIFIDNIDYLIILKIGLKAKKNVRESFITNKAEYDYVEKYFKKNKYVKLVYDYIEDEKYWI